ncbi:MAG: c-type cytochrome [Planctomycetota bacterium]|jgi:mono/diheme cytochrome c family protein
MLGKTLNIVLGSVMTVAIVLSLVGARDFSVPNLEVMPDMYHGPAFHAFEPNPNTKDGRTLREPPPGSIPRGLLPFPYGSTEAEALRAGEELRNPVPPDETDSTGRGSAAYAVYCQQCHGSGGEGDGMVAKRGFPPPPSLLLEHAIEMKDGQMFHVLTLGQGNMPGHAAQVSREDRWHIINYLRVMQKDAARRPAVAAPVASPSRESKAQGVQP